MSPIFHPAFWSSEKRTPLGGGAVWRLRGNEHVAYSAFEIRRTVMRPRATQREL
jgi:hypothetical protein